MIRPLRQRHRVTVYLLAVTLPTAFVAGVGARKPVPVATIVPAGLSRPANDFGRVVLTNPDLWPGRRIITRLRQDATGSVAVELTFRDLVKPDVLVYWAPEKSSAIEALPADARLIGTLLNRVPLPIPGEVRGEAGRLVLYSLADHEVVAVSSAFAIQKD